MKNQNQAIVTRLDSMEAAMADFARSTTTDKKESGVLQLVPTVNTRLHDIHLMYDQFSTK